MALVRDAGSLACSTKKLGKAVRCVEKQNKRVKKIAAPPSGDAAIDIYATSVS